MPKRSSSAQLVMENFFKLSKKDWLFLVIAFLGWRLGLFLVGYLANYWLPYRPSFPYAFSLLPFYNLPQWLYSWANFDGVHYLTIAARGYFGIGLIQAFFPVYPLLLRAVNWLIDNQILAGLMISNFCLAASLVIHYLLVKKISQNIQQAKLAVLVLLTFPTSFFWGALYGESLFFLILLVSQLGNFSQKKVISAVLNGLLSGVRVVGIFLPLAQLASWWPKTKKDALIDLTKLLCWLFVSSLGLLAFMVYLDWRFGDPLFFLHVQADFGAGRQENLILLPQTIWRSIKILLTARPFNWKYYSYAQDLMMTLIAGWLIWTQRQRVDLSWTVFSALAWLLPTTTGNLSSMPRYILVCWPIYFGLSRWLINQPQPLRWLYLTVSTFFLIINTSLFIQGYWLA